jgi:hypothetical protein
MRQEREDILGNVEKFEDGVLRADACMERYFVPRDAELRTFQEDLPSYSFGMSAVWEEHRLMRDVYRLISLGISPKGDYSLEEFVEKHRHLLSEEVI